MGSNFTEEDFKRLEQRQQDKFGGLIGNLPDELQGGQFDGLGGKLGANNPGAALFRQTDPLRRGLIERSESFIEGGLDVTQSPQFAALKQGAEDQFGRARKDIIASTAEGGALTSALTEAELAKAGALTRGTSDLAAQELNRAFSLATGQPLQAAIQGIGQQQAIQAQQQQAQAQQDAATKNALGTGFGVAAGSKAGPAGAAAGGAAGGSKGGKGGK